MAKRKVKTVKCRMARVVSTDRLDKVQIGSRWYRTKSGFVDVHPGNKTKVCPALSGKGYTVFQSAGAGKHKHEKLRLVAKRR